MSTNAYAVIEWTAPYRGLTKTWANVFHHSGAHLTTLSQVTTLWTTLSQSFGAFMSSGYTAYVSTTSYYDGSGGVPLFIQEYDAPGTPDPSLPVGFAPTGDAFTLSSSVSGNLEAATLLVAPAGVSATGKPVSLRKWCHCAPTASDEGLLSFGGGAGAYLAPLTNGSLPNAIVATSAAGRATTGGFEPYEYVSNHKLFRRKKASTSKSNSNLLSGALGTIADLAGAAINDA